MTITPEFDVDGNMTEYGDWSFAWDGENRLVEVASNSVTVVEHEYDYMGRRIKKIAGSETTTFIYDGWNMIRETIDDGVSQSANHYVWGLDLSGRRGGAGSARGRTTGFSSASKTYVCESGDMVVLGALFGGVLGL